MPLSPAVERFLTHLGSDAKAKATASGYEARCPAHEDAVASLSVAAGRDGRCLLTCHAGCSSESIVAAIGLTMGDLFAEPKKATRQKESTAPPPRTQRLVQSYDYTDEDGNLLYQVCRFEPKTFRQRRRKADGEWEWSLGEVRRVLYQLPRVIEAVAEQRPVFLVEGEKDADTLNEQGYIATTWPCGATAWRDEFADPLRGATVICLPDNDDVGRTAMQHAAVALSERGCTVKVVQMPGVESKGDFSDWYALGRTLDEFDAVVEATPAWKPDPGARVLWRLDELWGEDSIMRMPLPVVPRLAWPARSTLFAAAEKSGKSTVTGYVAAQVSTGGAFLGERCQAGPVLIIGLEEFLGDTARRLKHFHADGSRVFVMNKIPSDPRERPSAIRSRIHLVRPVLVIVDTLMAYSGGAISDASSSSQMQPVVQSLTDLAHETGVALILVHHARKSDGKYRDSSAIGGAVDAIVEVFVPDENADPTLRRARARGRMPLENFDFRYDGREFRLDRGEKAPLDQRIFECIRNRPAGVSTSDVADILGARKQDVLTFVTQMLADGRLRDLAGDTARARKLVVPAALGGQLFNPADRAA